MNTTVNQRGKVVFDLFEIDPNSGRLRAYFAASDGLEGEAWLSGSITADGELDLTGSLSQFAMNIRGHLTSRGKINAAYSLRGATNQSGNFEVTFDHSLAPETSADRSKLASLIGAWEVGGGMPAQTNPVTGIMSGISFVDARRLEILPDGQFTHLHSHEHCEGSGAGRCCLQTATMERGTIEFDGSQVVFNITGGDDIARSNCNPRINKQGHVAARKQVFSWTVGSSANGGRQLCLQGGESNERTCYQKQS